MTTETVQCFAWWPLRIEGRWRWLVRYCAELEREPPESGWGQPPETVRRWMP